MRSIDFEYDGICLSDYGFIICQFDASSGADRVESGSKIVFNKIPSMNGKKHNLTGTKYEDCFQSTFDICKNPDTHEPDERFVTDEEYRLLVRWLNQRSFKRVRFFSDEIRDICYYNASFNINKIEIGGLIYGLELTMETDAPFGYREEQRHNISFTNNALTYTIYDPSDEIGYIYPNIKIVCQAAGRLSFENDDTDSGFVIDNCSVGEEIEIDGNTQTISTSLQSHDIFNDFNYEFLKIGNTFDNRKNTITATAPCEVVITYSPINKGTP